MNWKIKRTIFAVIAIIVTAGFFYVRSADAQEPNKKIEVDLTEQRLRAYENTQLVYDFPISSGTWQTPTPTGGFWPWVKIRSDDMEGGTRIAGDYYYLPNVPYVMYFYNENYPKWQGYAIHGTYWHNNFGTPMSHGCINLSIENAEKLYYWTDIHRGNGQGTMIIVKN